MAGTERLLEAIDKMTLALQELREAVLELTAEEPAPAAEPTPVSEPEAIVINAPEPVEVVVSQPEPEPQPVPEAAPVVVSEPVTVSPGIPEPTAEAAPAPAPEAAPAEKKCPVCGEPVKPGNRFCMKCGASIPEDAPAPAAEAVRVYLNDEFAGIGAPQPNGDVKFRAMLYRPGDKA